MHVPRLSMTIARFLADPASRPPSQILARYLIGKSSSGLSSVACLEYPR